MTRSNTFRNLSALAVGRDARKVMPRTSERLEAESPATVSLAIRQSSRRARRA